MNNCRKMPLPKPWHRRRGGKIAWERKNNSMDSHLVGKEKPCTTLHTPLQFIGDFLLAFCRRFRAQIPWSILMGGHKNKGAKNVRRFRSITSCKKYCNLKTNPSPTSFCESVALRMHKWPPTKEDHLEQFTGLGSTKLFRPVVETKPVSKARKSYPPPNYPPAQNQYNTCRKESWGINFCVNTCGACIRTRANTGNCFRGILFRIVAKLLREFISAVRIHVALVFAPTQTLEKIPGELFTLVLCQGVFPLWFLFPSSGVI